MTDKDRVKREALARWIALVNDVGNLGKWCSDISFNVKDVNGIIDKHLKD